MALSHGRRKHRVARQIDVAKGDVLVHACRFSLSRRHLSPETIAGTWSPAYGDRAGRAQARANFLAISAQRSGARRNIAIAGKVQQPGLASGQNTLAERGSPPQNGIFGGRSKSTLSFCRCSLLRGQRSAPAGQPAHESKIKVYELCG